MFYVIYSFTVKPNLEKDFVKGWTGLTQLIYKHEGSLGSRLHQKSDNEYIAYAQWPLKATWKNSGNNLPEQANNFRKLMKESCTKIQTEMELPVTVDLLVLN